MIIVRLSRFSKSSVFKMFSIHTKTKSLTFKFLQFEERKKYRNNVTFTFSNSSVMWMDSKSLNDSVFFVRRIQAYKMKTRK